MRGTWRKHGYRWLPRLSLVGAAGFLAAATLSPTAILNLLAHTQRFDVAKDISYAAGPRRRLDVYQPQGASVPAPVLVFFYGGSWQTGSKDTYLFLASTLASRGYVVIIPDYRVYPQVKFPAFLRDAATAVRWARDNAASYGGDSRRIFVMGHSAGAYIAAMLAMDGEWLATVGMDPRRDLAGLIGVSGPYDFLPLKDETLKVIFEGDSRVQTQPITFSQGEKPPTLLLTGSGDRTVNPTNTRSLATQLRRSGNTVTDIVYRHFGHISILLGFVPVVGKLFPALDDIDAFVAKATLAEDGHPPAAAAGMP